MGNVIGARVPGWFRLFSLLGLLWNALGVFMYLKSVGIFGDPLAGLEPAHAELARSVPAWVTGAFAIAVFAGLLGSLCMVAGKRLASSLLSLSLLAVIVQSAWIVLISNARAVEGMLAVAMPACLVLIAFLLLWLAGKGTAKGWLD
jgi:hypothetical protein